MQEPEAGNMSSPATDATTTSTTDPESLQRLECYVSGLRDRLTVRSAERAANDRGRLSYSEEDCVSGRLDSSIKKNSAFVRRIRTSLSESSRESMLREVSGLNVTKYISEVTSALVEVKIKMTDVPTVIAIAGHLHQRYPDFSASFADAWSKVLPRKPADLSAINVSKLRVDVRLFAELIAVNIFTLKEGLPILGQVLKLLTTGSMAGGGGGTTDTTSSSSSADGSSHLPVLLSFCRSCAEDFLGTIPYSMAVIASDHPSIELPSLSSFLSPERQKILLSLMQDYLSHLIRKIHQDKRSLRHMDQQNRKILMSRGELSSERKDQFDQSSLTLNKFICSTQQFADLIGQPFPDLPPDPIDVLSEFESGVSETMSIEISNRFKGEGIGCENDPHCLFEDEDTRTFYQSVPDLKSQIPSILYKDSAKEESSVPLLPPASGSPERMDESSAEKPDQSEETAAATAVVTGSPDQMETEDEKDLLNDLTASSSGKPSDLLFVEGEDMDLNLDAEDKSLEETTASVTTTTAGDNNNKPANSSSASATVPKANNKILMDAFLSSLTACISREHVDKSAVHFCTHLNSKSNRNRLIRTLFTVPRNRLDLLPFYGRLAVTLRPVMPHVATDLVSALKQDFKFHVRKKDQINLESKVKTMRFIGELVKFDLFSKVDALNCLKILLLDFKHHQIPMACTLVESCGRFLFRSPESHARMNLLLEQMMRKKSLLPYDSVYVTMIENAFYSANTSVETGTGITKIDRPVMHQYIRKLLYSDLRNKTVDRVCRSLRKLDWDNGSIVSYLIRCMTAVHNIPFLHIGAMAHLLSCLTDWHEDAVFRVVDGVMEDIKLLMQVNQVKFNQRRIAMAHFLGQLYTYRLVDTDVVFQQLYSFVSYAVTYPPDDGDGNGGDGVVVLVADGAKGAGVPVKEDPEKKEVMGHSIYSPLDPPDSLFRIRLVCTLLDSSAEYFTSASARSKLDCFILYFQRYYWLKRSHVSFAAAGVSKLTSAMTGNAFPIEIENLFIDTIRGLRPNFVFAKNFKQANDLVQQLVSELRSKAVELYPELVKKESSAPNTTVANGQKAKAGDSNDLNCIPEEREEDDDEEDDDEDDDDDNNDEEEDEVTENEDMDDEEEDSDSSSGDEEETSSDSGSDSDSEQENHNNNNAKKSGIAEKTPSFQSPEDEEFQKEFERMMSESLMSRVTETVKPLSDISIPLDYEEKTIVATGLSRNRKNKSGFAATATAATSLLNPGLGTTTAGHEDRANTMRLTVMTRASHKGPVIKPLFRAVNVPLDSELAIQLKQKEAELRKEKEQLKQLTLVMNDRIDEAEASGQQQQQQVNPAIGPAGSVGSSGGNSGHSYLRNKKYHQRGVPDASLIFGSSAGNNDPPPSSSHHHYHHHGHW